MYFVRTKPNRICSADRPVRCVGIPIVAVSRGWTGETFRVRFYDALDCRVLRWMDQVVCVSESQARKVRQAGVSSEKIKVIWNAIRVERFCKPQAVYVDCLRSLFPQPPQRIVLSAGRLSPEKGFEVLIAAATKVVLDEPSVGFVVFGEGALRKTLENQIRRLDLNERFILAEFHHDLDNYFPYADLVVLPSYTEGLPNVVLEAFAAGVPVVATAVGGTPEVIEDGINGYLVPPYDAEALAQRISDILANDELRRQMGLCGQQQIKDRFSFSIQALAYQRMFTPWLSHESVPI